MINKLLILGGNGFISKNLVDKIISQSAGYEIILANRGSTNPFPHIDTRIINRECGVECGSLEGLRVDTVVDFSCFRKKHLESVIDRIYFENYIFISSTAATNEKVLNDESDPFHEYAKQKRDAENFLIENFKGEVLFIVRPPVVFGAGDHTGRSYDKNGEFYWRHNNQKAENTIYSIKKENLNEFLIYIIKELNQKKINQPYNKINQINATGELYESIKGILQTK